MKTIICEAIPFGYGPAAILYSFIKELSKEFNIIIASSGSTFNFFKESHFKTVFCSSYDQREIKETIQKYQENLFAVLSVENERFLYAAKELSVRTIYIDLFEFIWDTTLEYMPYADLYVVYTLFENTEKIKRLQDKGVLLLSPKVEKLHPMVSTSKDKKLLVHIGGLNSSCITSSHLCNYSNFLSLFIRELKNLNPENEIDIVTSGEVYYCLKKLFDNHQEIKLYHDIPHGDFLRILSECSNYYTTPGITSTLTGIFNQKKTHLILPANYTQFEQLSMFKRFFNNDTPSIDYYKEGFASTMVKEKEGIEQIEKFFSKLDIDIKDYAENVMCNPFYTKKNLSDIFIKRENSILSVIKSVENTNVL